MAMALGHQMGQSSNDTLANPNATLPPEPSAPVDVNQPTPQSLFERELEKIPIGNTTSAVPQSSVTADLLAGWFTECVPQVFFQQHPGTT